MNTTALTEVARLAQAVADLVEEYPAGDGAPARLTLTGPDGVTLAVDMDAEHAAWLAEVVTAEHATTDGRQRGGPDRGRCGHCGYHPHDDEPEFDSPEYEAPDV